MSQQELTRYMWMSSPQEALDVIAEMIDMQSPLTEQDDWLKATVALGYVKIIEVGDGREFQTEVKLEEAQRSREYGYTHPTPDDFDASLDDPNYEEGLE